MVPGEKIKLYCFEVKNTNDMEAIYGKERALC